MNETKHCPKCKKNFPATPLYFYREKRRPDGLHALCKQCKSFIDKTSRSSSPTSTAYQSSPSYAFSQLKYQAKKRNIPFLLDEVFFLTFLSNRPCYYCGSPASAPSHLVDRVDQSPSIGYTEANTVPCCRLCLKMKGNLSAEEFVSHAKKIALDK